MVLNIVAFYRRINLKSLAFQEMFGFSFYLIEVEVL